MSKEYPHGKKSTSRKRVLSFRDLDRTGGFKHEHYSHRDVAAAMDAVEGQTHHD